MRTPTAVTDAPSPRTLDAAAEAKSGARFFVVSAGAFLTDLIVVITVLEVFDISVTAAAGIGFLSAWFGSYLGHEYWTFRGTNSRFAVDRLGRNLLSNLVAISARLSIIFTLESLRPTEERLQELGYFLVGAGCSFLVNFLINRFWVFVRK